jgi:hypothetical protein
MVLGFRVMGASSQPLAGGGTIAAVMSFRKTCLQS